MISIQDRADEFRITIVGRFSGESVLEAEKAWQLALQQQAAPVVTIDISQLTSYNVAGRKLLRDMHRHGARFAASTALSLVFLGDISAPRRHGITVIPELAPATTAAVETRPSLTQDSKRLSTAAAAR